MCGARATGIGRRRIVTRGCAAAGGVGERTAAVWISATGRVVSSARGRRESQAIIPRISASRAERKADSSQEVVRVGVVQPVLSQPNQEWSLDFVCDALGTGRAVRVLSIVDNFTRECLALETHTSFASMRVTRVWTRSSRNAAFRKLCNGQWSGTASRHFLAWCTERKIAMHHIQPGKPMQNGHVESFNGRLRDECLNASWFRNYWTHAKDRRLAGRLQRRPSP